MKYIVYLTTNTINNKIYIGVHGTENPDKFDGYLGNSVYANRPNSYEHPKYPFQYAVKKYGPKNFIRKVLKVFDNLEDAFDLERWLVCPEFIARKDTYNIALEGKGGDIAKNAKKCYQYDLNGNFICEYDSEQQASIAVNRGFTTIKRAIKEKIKAGNFFWSEEKYDILDLTKYKTNSNKKLIYQYSDNLEYDCCYESVSKAAELNESSTSNIYRACETGTKVNNKYFSYIQYNTFEFPEKINIRGHKIYQYSLEGDFIAEYNNCSQAEKALNKSRGLSTAIKLGRTFAGYQWSLEKVNKMPNTIVKKEARKVGQYTIDGNLVKIYNTVTECTKDFSGCRHVLHGDRKTSGGYIFKYID